MRKILDDPAEREIRIFERPLSGIKTNGQKIRYFKFISSLENKDCNKALKRILPKIDTEEIYKIVDETPFISEFTERILQDNASGAQGTDFGLFLPKTPQA